MNANRRRDAFRWLAGKPFGHLVLQRVLMEPLRQLLSDQLRVASADWEKGEQCKVAQSLESGTSGEQMSRRYRLSIAASCDNEQHVMKQMKLLWKEPALWIAIPPECYIVDFRGLAFRCLSKLACSTYQLLQTPHKQFPVRLFLLLEQPELADEMARAPQCLLDPWTANMRKLHPTFSGDEFCHKLALFALLMWKDTAVIEAKHASVRRLLTTASVHTHSQSFGELAAQWVFLQVRTRAQPTAQLQAGKRRKFARRVANQKAREARRAAAKAGHCTHTPPPPSHDSFAA